MLIIGTKLFTWGSTPTDREMRCGSCNSVARFIKVSGMRFLTIFFVIPVFPLSGVKQMVQCPNCGTKFNAS